MDGRLSEVLEEFCLLHEFAGKEGSTASARVGAAARHVAVVGLGPAAAAKPVAAWGASPFQVAPPTRPAALACNTFLGNFRIHTA